MGLSRNKVAVPEGAAGTPPFWSLGNVGLSFMLSDSLATFAVYVINIDQGELREVRYPPLLDEAKKKRQSYSSVG